MVTKSSAQSAQVPDLANLLSNASSDLATNAAADADDKIQSTRFRWMGQYQEALGSGQYQEADVLAKQILESILADDPVVSLELARALGNLGLVQKLMEQYVTSAQNYMAAIEVIEDDEDMLSQHLVPPLQGLAAVHRANGEIAQALRTYERALHINQVNQGPHSLGQVDILDAMIDSNLEAGDLKSAFALLDRLKYLYEREFSLHGIELVPVLIKRARLLNRLDQHGAEREVYRRVVAIMEKSYGDSDLALVKPYLALGNTYLYQIDQVVYRSEPSTQTGETYFEKALVIAEGHADSDWQTLEECLLALGDYYMLLSVNDRAQIQYQRAWDLTSNDESLDHRKKELEQPVVLRRPSLGRYADFKYGWDVEEIDPEDLVEGHITARYTVTARGRISDIELLEASPEDFSKMETRVRRGLRKFIFRPRHEDGKPVRTVGESYKHEFLYLPADIVRTE